MRRRSASLKTRFAPVERLLEDLAALCGYGKGGVVAVGESSVADLRTRPDYAVTVQGALVGFIELKAPGKGADPRRFREGADRAGPRHHHRH